MPRSTREGWIDWRNSAAKQIIMDDLHCGILPADAAELSALEAWDICYKHMVEFVSVDYNQFRDRLRDHQLQAWKDIVRARSESDSLAHDQLLFPWRAVNNHGEPVFDTSDAKLLLHADVKEGKHNTMTPAELQSNRVEYHPFNPRKFKHRIYQEVCRVKFINWLEQKRGGAEEEL
jgi:hypothetical protein